MSCQWLAIVDYHLRPCRFGKVLSEILLMNKVRWWRTFLEFKLERDYLLFLHLLFLTKLAMHVTACQTFSLYILFTFQNQIFIGYLWLHIVNIYYGLTRVDSRVPGLLYFGYYLEIGLETLLLTSVVGRQTLHKRCLVLILGLISLPLGWLTMILFIW